MRGLTTDTWILIDASDEGTLREKTDVEVTTLIENMCQNEYRSTERVVKENVIDTQIALRT